MLSLLTPPSAKHLKTPFLKTPQGDIWKLSHGTLFRNNHPHFAKNTYLCRRIDGIRDSLKLSAIFQHISNYTQPNIYGPKAWKHTEQGFYIVTDVPAGVLLTDDAMPLLIWSEAFSAWTRLARALHKLHQRGIVHGQLLPWNIWYSENDQQLTAIDAGCWAGDNVNYANISSPFIEQWIAPEMRSEGSQKPTPATDVYGLANLLLFLCQLGARQTSGIRSFSGLPAYVIPILRRALAADPRHRITNIDELIIGCAFHPSEIHVDRKKVSPPNAASRNRTILFGRVDDINHISHPTRGPGIKFLLSPPPSNESIEEDLHTPAIGTFFYEKADPNLYQSIQHIWPGAEINLFNARILSDSTGRSFLTGQPDTIPVLEPHWPVTVSDALNAQDCISQILVDHREPQRSNSALITGNLVHGLMEDLSNMMADDVENALQKRLCALRLDMLAAKMTDNDLAALLANARQHIQHLKTFTTHNQLTPSSAEGRHHAEATRYSNLYGLEGRIDLVTQSTSSELNIIELKTGKPWHTHAQQLRFYTLLWQDYAQKHNLTMSGEILYSRNGARQRTSMKELDSEQRLLLARNELVAFYRSFVDSNIKYSPPYYQQFPAKCASCKWHKQRCQKHTDVLALSGVIENSKHWQKQPTKIAQRAHDYYRHYTRLITIERWFQITSLGKILRQSSLSARVDAYESAVNLSIESVDIDQQLVRLQSEQQHPFTPGDYLLVHRGNFIDEHILLGVCVDAGSNSLLIKTRGASLAHSLPEKNWTVDLLPTRLGYRSAHQAIYRLLEQNDHARLSIIIDTDNPQSADKMRGTNLDQCQLSSATKATLNKSQQVAIKHALTSPVGTIIQGPPGSGKTTVVAFLAKEVLIRNQTLLLATLTNTAIDTLLIKLLECGITNFLRLGHSQQSPELRRALEYKNLDPKDFFINDLTHHSDSLHSLAQRLKQCPIIAGTTHRISNTPTIPFLTHARKTTPFDIAIVDEASQLTEPMTLGPITLAQRFVLVGDQMQLPPIVQNELAYSSHLSDIPASIAPIGCRGLDQSLFERLIDKLPFSLLDTQYRMNASIMAYSNRAFYHNLLIAHHSVENRLLIPPQQNDLNTLTDAHLPVVFVDTRGKAQGRVNWREAEAIVNTLINLNSIYPTDTLGVISPYRAQVQLIRDLVHQSEGIDGTNIDIDTVEKFQGSERDIILVSFVKTDYAGDFLTDEQRLNVIFTRARKKLIAFGHRECLIQMPNLKQFIEQDETTVVEWDCSQL